MRTGFVLLLFGVLLAPRPCAAQNGLEHLSQGAKAAGRGGASTAMADDALAVGRNPALLTQLRGTRADGLIVLNIERIRRRNESEEDLETKTTLWPLPFVAFATDLGDESAWDDLDDGPRTPSIRLGFGIHQPIMGTVAPTGTIAFDFGGDISMGVSLNVLLTRLSFKSGEKTKGGGPSPLLDFRPAGLVSQHYQADGTPVTPPQPYDPGTGSQLTWAEVFDIGLGAATGGSGGSGSGGGVPGVEYEISVFGAGVAAQLGFLWTPRDDFALGLSVRSPGIIFSPKGEGRIDLGATLSGLEANPSLGLLVGALRESFLPDRGQHGLASDYDLAIDDIKLPPSVSLGIAWWPSERWVVTADLRWIGWSHSLNTLTVTASGGTNRDLNEITGGPGLTYTLELDWDDQVVFALGTTFAANEWLLLRAGYNYGNNPIPNNGVFNNFMVIEHHLTCGAGLRLGNWDLDLAYSWGLPKRVDRPGASFKVELHQFFVGVGYAF